MQKMRRHRRRQGDTPDRPGLHPAVPNHLSRLPGLRQDRQGPRLQGLPLGAVRKGRARPPYRPREGHEGRRHHRFRRRGRRASGPPRRKPHLHRAPAAARDVHPRRQQPQNEDEHLPRRGAARHRARGPAAGRADGEGGEEGRHAAARQADDCGRGDADARRVGEWQPGDRVLGGVSGHGRGLAQRRDSEDPGQSAEISGGRRGGGGGGDWGTAEGGIVKCSDAVSFVRAGSGFCRMLECDALN
mmetsp:Transcript_26313/g.65817  ORF Transcript_26313/g.65817 Transcript_26313/m.65817 type:complete len:244 (-) Transcript_26313:27-758(-)